MGDEKYSVFSMVGDYILENQPNWQVQYHTLAEARDYAQKHHWAMWKLRPELADTLYTLVDDAYGEQVFVCFFRDEVMVGDEAHDFADKMMDEK